ncbi:UDP-glycosyltransferase 86A2 [Acorus calamus]|uniref:Glycosyltransferase n=1 Tax=Acorus calamus TaxID=4465 RepID=A0AAV9C3N0_ACOCL|nr:UDP-glycosyltransferase 86A2 [Acorus calamus]
MMAPSTAQRRPHAILVAYPLQGHVIPSVHLALKLASRGLSITFVNTLSVHHQTLRAHSPTTTDEEDVFACARRSGLDIRYEVVSDGLPLGFDRSLNHDQFMNALLHVLSAHVEELARGVEGVDCLIADTFFVWPATLARRLGIAYVSFWTEPALVFTLYYHLDLLRRNGHFGSNDNRDDTIDYIPGVPSLQLTDLPSYLQDTDTSTVVHQIIYKAFSEAKRADFVLCNTVQELEPSTISALQSTKPFYAVGPLFPSASISTVPTSLWSESDCTHFLDPKPDHSVLYVSFGSYAHLSKHDLTEIALGLLDSRVSFLWVLRPDIVSSDDPDPLPAGFVESAGDRGLVVPWCRQAEVLKHRAVGGFLTHCGWNSVMESIWCGVPMLCLPLLTDQFVNRRLVVEEWRVGTGVEGRPRREKVAKKIGEVMMGGKVREGFVREIRETRRALENAVAVGGSSEVNLDRFIEDLTK